MTRPATTVRHYAPAAPDPHPSCRPAGIAKSGPAQGQPAPSPKTLRPDRVSCVGRACRLVPAPDTQSIEHRRYYHLIRADHQQSGARRQGQNERAMSFRSRPYRPVREGLSTLPVQFAARIFTRRAHGPPPWPRRRRQTPAGWTRGAGGRRARLPAPPARRIGLQAGRRRPGAWP